MRTILFVMVLLLPLCLIAEDHSEQIETIIFLRHGEKPMLEYGQMNCQGLNRSLHLPKILQDKFGKPNDIFAPNPFARLKNNKGFYYYVRAFATIEPTAIYNGMDVKADHPFFKNQEIAKDLLDPKYRNALLIVSWEHFNIPAIAKNIITALHGDPSIIPRWKGNDYDSLYILKIHWTGPQPKVDFIHAQEALNNQDKTCPDTTKLSQHKNNFQKIIIIPAAEENENALDQLSCKGLNRALFLPEVLRSKYGEIDKFIIPAKEESANGAQYVAGLMTLEPTVVNANKPLFVVGNSAHLAAESLKHSALHAGNILISWPQNDILDLLQVVISDNGGDPRNIPPITPSNDAIYEITIDLSHKQLPIFSQSSQHLGGLSDRCPYQP